MTYPEYEEREFKQPPDLPKRVQRQKENTRYRGKWDWFIRKCNELMIWRGSDYSPWRWFEFPDYRVASSAQSTLRAYEKKIRARTLHGFVFEIHCDREEPGLVFVRKAKSGVEATGDEYPNHLVIDYDD